MQSRPLGIEGVIEIVPRCFSDRRGSFSETYNQRAFADIGITAIFVQDNHSISRQKGVLRGLHFQAPPFDQAKLVRVVRGRVYDVVVDLRRGSSTYKQSIGLELSAEKWNQVFVPRGCAHGFLTLTDQCEVIYKVDAFYAPSHDAGIVWNDPDLAIAWPNGAPPLLSDKDMKLPLFRDIAPTLAF